MINDKTQINIETLYMIDLPSSIHCPNQSTSQHRSWHIVSHISIQAASQHRPRVNASFSYIEFYAKNNWEINLIQKLENSTILTKQFEVMAASVSKGDIEEKKNEKKTTTADTFTARIQFFSLT